MFAQSLGIKSAAQWREYCKGNLPNLGGKPEDIPTAADRVYHDEGWLGWADWLGTEGKPRLGRAKISTLVRTTKSIAVTTETSCCLRENVLSLVMPGTRLAAGMDWTRHIVDLPRAQRELSIARLVARDFQIAMPEELEPADVFAVLLTALRAFLYPKSLALTNAAQDADSRR